MIEYNQKKFHYDVPEDIYDALYNKIIHDALLITTLSYHQNTPYITRALLENNRLEKILIEGFKSKTYGKDYTGNNK